MLDPKARETMQWKHSPCQIQLIKSKIMSILTNICAAVQTDTVCKLIHMSYIRSNLEIAQPIVRPCTTLAQLQHAQLEMTTNKWLTAVLLLG